jgi:hypothetical protein
MRDSRACAHLSTLQLPDHRSRCGRRGANLLLRPLRARRWPHRAERSRLNEPWLKLGSFLDFPVRCILGLRYHGIFCARRVGRRGFYWLRTPLRPWHFTFDRRPGFVQANPRLLTRVGGGADGFHFNRSAKVFRTVKRVNAALFARNFTRIAVVGYEIIDRIQKEIV